MFTEVKCHEIVHGVLAFPEYNKPFVTEIQISSPVQSILQKHRAET